jgi:hypothetical protein
MAGFARSTRPPFKKIEAAKDRLVFGTVAKKPE